jgi:hypothetical protein
VRQLEALLGVLFGAIQVVPLVGYARQAKMGFAGIRLGMIAKQL